MLEHSAEEYRLLKAQPGILDRIKDFEGDGLRLQSELRREHPAAVVRLAISIMELRRKAGSKFDRAAQMWFDRVGLEQSTGLTVARHKAERFQSDVWDLCCGIGADTIALARNQTVTSVDVELVHCLQTQWNSEVYGAADHVQTVCADVQALNLRDQLIHIDPDRRSGPKRALRIEHYAPGPDYLKRLIESCRGGAIKLGPATNFGGQFPGCEVELISDGGECKEATIWFGELQTPGIFYRATVLPSGETLAADPLDAWPEQSALGQYLFDPDPAIVRAGLLDVLSNRLQLFRLDPEEEYLTSDKWNTSPFVRGFEVLAELPNNERQIRAWFRSNPLADVEIKCRRIPVDASRLRRRIPLKGEGKGVLIFARISGKARAVVARRVI